MARLTINLFGGFAVRSVAGETIVLPMRRAQALLTFLAVPPGQSHPREKLTALLWPELEREEARARLRHTLFSIRRALGDDFAGLRADGDTVALDPKAIDVDAVEFERLSRARDRAALEHAAELYRGDLLSGLPAREGPFEDWLGVQRERLRELAVETLGRLLRLHTDADEHEAGVRTALRLLELDPLQEPVHRALMRLYLQLGRRGAALRQYQQCVTALQRELGVEPDDDTKAVYRTIVRAGSPTRASVPRAAESSGARATTTTRPGVAAPAGDTALVGRVAEMTTLRQALEQASRGNGRTLIISGEAGAGKSRLVTEIASDAFRRGALVLVGRSHATERILPFSPWIEALRSAPAAALRSVSGTVGKSMLAELARLVPELGDAAPPSRVEAEGWRTLFDAVAALLRGLASSRPVLLILEDLHWADEMTLRLLAFVVRRLSAWPVVAIGTVREEEIDDAELLRGMLEELACEPHVEHVELHPLSMEEIGSLTALLARSADAASRRRLAEQAWRTSQGNALVAVETVRALRARPVDAPETRLPLPRRVRDLVRERFGRLGETARELLPIAALIGRDFEFTLLHRASGLDEEAVAAGVEELVRRRVLQGLGERFDFTHDRIREVARADMLAPRRRLLHRRIGEAIETLHVDAIEPHVAALAVHFRDGEVWDKAAGYLRRAAMNAWQRSAFRESSQLAEEALRALELLPRSTTALVLSVDIRLMLHRAYFSLGTFDRAHEHLLVAETDVAELDDPVRKARVAIYLNESYRVSADYERALRYGAEGFRLAAVANDELLIVEANFHQGVIQMVRGDIDEARGHFEAGVRTGAAWPLARRAGYPYVICLTRLARIAVARGDFDDALRFVQIAIEIAEATEHPFTCADAYHHLGWIAAAQGRGTEAVPVLERAQRIAEDHYIRVQHPLLPANLGYALAIAGRAGEAVAVLRRILAEPIGLQNVAFGLTWSLMAAGFQAAGHLAEAREAAERGLAYITSRRERVYEAAVLLQLADVEAADTPPRRVDADARYREALTIASAMAFRPTVAHCHLGLGRLAAAGGDASAARHHLATAATLYREMAMTSWLAETEETAARL